MKVDKSKFSHKIGDTVYYFGTRHKVVAYYFEDGFNNFQRPYGYVLQGLEGFHTANKCAYMEDGSRFMNITGKRAFINVPENEIERCKGYFN
jgi:hypothetical protein